MDRFSWSDGNLNTPEQLLIVQKGVRLYDGPERTAFDKGKIMLTTYRLLWTDNNKSTSVLSLPLSYSAFIEKESGGFTKCPKIKIHLLAKAESQSSGPFSHSSFSFIQLGFTESGQDQFFTNLKETISDRKWERIPQKPEIASKSGIGGIERSLQMRKQDRDASISVAFEDLNNLMKKAQDMVNLSKNISIKLREKQGTMSVDETIQFKSYLMGLGITDPITRESHGSGGSYYEGLAREICQFIEDPLKDCGGIMTLPDVYCRINRARGMELLSPEDLEQACRLLQKLDLAVRLKEYDDGVKVVQLHSCDETILAEETAQYIKEREHMSVNELATLMGLSVVLARQRLLVAESLGKLCRDESSEGLIFYPNLLLTSLY